MVPSERLGAANGQLAGWAALAVLNTVVLAATLPPQTWASAIDRLAHHYYDAAHALSLGFVSWGAGATRSRLAPRRSL